MGGIPTNHLGEVLKTTFKDDGSFDSDSVVPGLFAAGECASASVHGANRLGANSLLDIVVFGRACANRIADIAKPNTPNKPMAAGAGDQSIADLDKIRFSSGSIATADLRLAMQKTMQMGAGVYRTQET